MTIEEKVNLIEKKLSVIEETIKKLPKAYASKLQWKQLDNLRRTQLEEVRQWTSEAEDLLKLLKDKAGL